MHNVLQNLRLILMSTVLNGVGADLANMGHYSESLIDAIMEIYMGNSSTLNISSSSSSRQRNYKTEPNGAILVPTYIYPYILLTLWIICIVIIICCCLQCKCQQAEMMTSYSSNNFELQEVHVMDHPLPHVKGCVCLCCLQQQLALELQLKRE